MSKPKIDIKISKNPHAFDVSRKIGVVAALDMKSKEEATLYVHEYFLKYLKELIPTEEEQRIILESLVSQQTEKYDMTTNENNPFYGQEAAFEQYCRVRYKKLYDYIDRMLERIFPD